VSIKDAVITNLVDAFPDATIYEGKVVQGVQPDDFVVNTVFNEVTIFKGSTYRRREITIQVSVIQPTDEVIADKIVEAVKEVTANGVVHYPQSAFVEDSDGAVKVLIDFSYLER